MIITKGYGNNTIIGRGYGGIFLFLRQVARIIRENTQLYRIIFLSSPLIKKEFE